MQAESLHAIHSAYIGGSNTAAACGQSRYKTAWELFMQMKGQIPMSEYEANHFRMGRLLEPVVRQVYCDDLQRIVRAPETIYSSTYDWMCANVDGISQGANDARPRVWEGKSCAVPDWEEWGDEGSDAVPVEYLFQCHKYMIVTGLELCDLSVILQRFKVRHYTISADRELHEMIIDAERDFMARFRADDPPPLEYSHPSAIEALKKVYRGSNGTRIVADEMAEQARAQMTEARAALKKAGEEADALKAYLLHAMGDATYLAFQDGKAYRRAEVERSAYSVEATTFIDARFVNDPMVAKRKPARKAVSNGRTWTEILEDGKPNE